MATQRQKIYTIDTAQALRQRIGSQSLVAFDDVCALVENNPEKLTPQEVIDALSEDGVFGDLYEDQTALLVLLRSRFPAIKIAYFSREIVLYIEGGKLGGIWSEVPFDVERARYPKQPSRADAEAFAAALVVPEGGDE